MENAAVQENAYSDDVHVADPRKRTPRPKNSITLTPKRAFKRKFENEVKTTEPELETPTKRQRVNAIRRYTRVQPAFTAPVTWHVECNSEGKAIYADEDKCMIGTRDQRVISVTHDGHFIEQHKLNNPVAAIFKDGDFLYAWCSPRLPVSRVAGSLYELSVSPPRRVLDAYDFPWKVVHAAMLRGCLVLVNNQGDVRVQGLQGQIIWERMEEDLGDGGMLEVDDTGVYVAHKKSVRKYSVDCGDDLWEFKVKGSGRLNNIQTGMQYANSIFIEAGGQVLQIDKQHGGLIKQFRPDRHRAAGTIVGNGLLITGEFPSVIFDVETGKELYRMLASFRMKDSVALFPNSRQLLIFWDKLYNVDLTEQAISRAAAGRSVRTFEYALPEASVESTAEDQEERKVERVEERSLGPRDGKLVEVREERGVLKVKRKATDTKDWSVSFPLDITLQAGDLYLVKDLIPSERGQYYRIKGQIKKVVK